LRLSSHDSHISVHRTLEIEKWGANILIIRHHRIVALCAGLAVLGAAGVASAQYATTKDISKATPIPLDKRMKTDGKTTAGQHVPLFILSTHGENVGTEVPAGDVVAIDTPQKFRCKEKAGCTILIGASVQVMSATDGATWAIASYVDGEYVPNTGYFQGVINTADSYKIGNSRQYATVAPGNHTVSSAVYISGGGTMNQYQIDYEVTTP
jgi:hypothetical protein